jgi:hypothetical protein
MFMFTLQSMRYKVMKPNNRTIVYGIPLLTNQLGFRDRTDGIRAREPGEQRIIVLGDSYTVSAGVPFESLYTQVAERDLARLSRNPRVKVLNLATAGYNILQFYYTLTESGLSLSPDYVVAGVLVARDFDRMVLYEEAHRIALGELPSAPRWIDRLYLTRAFGGYVQHVYNRLVGALGINPIVPASSGAPEERQINEKALLDIQSVLAQRHIPFLVILLPQCYDFSKQQGAHLTTGNFLRSHHIEFIDMLPFFISDGHSPSHFVLNIIDRHPNVRYNQLVAEELANTLATRLASKGNIQVAP